MVITKFSYFLALEHSVLNLREDVDFTTSLVGLGHRIDFISTKTPANVCPGYDSKQSDGEAPVLELWGM